MQALRQSEARYRSLASATTLLIWITDAKGHVVEDLPTLQDFIGMTPAEIAGTGWLSSVHPDDRAHAVAAWSAAVEQGTLFETEYRMRRHDGQYRDMAVRGVPVRNEDGTVREWVGTCRDITNRKQSREILRLQTTALQAAANSIVITHRDGRILWANSAFTRLTGYTLPEVAGESPRILRSGQQTTDFYRRLWETILAGRVWQGEVINRRKDGSLYTEEMTITPVVGDDGSIHNFIAIKQDITDRKRAEEDLRHSAEKYRDLFEYASYGVFRSTPDGQFLDVNPALVEMLGYESKADLLKVNLGADVYLSPQPRAEILKRPPTEGRRVAETEFRRKDGRVLKVRLSGREVRNHEGELQCYEVIAEDVTQQRNLEEQLRQVQKMEAVGQLSGGIAHDFNNLLNVIMGYTQLALEQTPQDDRRHRQLEQVLAASERATALTRQLLAFSRKQVLEPRLITLDSAIDEAEKMLRRLIGEDIRLILRHSKCRDAVRVDPGQMLQVIINLAVNARDAMLGGGTLSIETSVTEFDEFYCRSHSELTPGRYVMLAVSDTGCGMDPHIKSRIFEPFFTTKPKGKGTGLGLSTVYGIVKQSGGHIAVYSELGKGTSFKIYFPSVQSMAASASPVTRVETYRGGSETVLVVEDDTALREFAYEQLTSLGYRVLSAGHGEEALTIAQAESIDLLLTDVVMPGMNGRQLAERIALLQPPVQVLYVSGYTENAITHDGVLDPGIAFLGKPYKAADLARRVRELLDDRQKKPIASVLASSNNASAPGTDETVA
jgi:PAS domain S-box-containing protein